MQLQSRPRLVPYVHWVWSSKSLTILSLSVSLKYWLGDEPPLAESTSSFPYICNSLRKFTAGPTKPKFTWWRVDASFIAYPKCLLHRMVCELLFPFLKTQISREFLIARAPPFSVSCDFVGRVQLEKWAEASARPLYASASGSGFLTNVFPESRLFLH